MIGDIVRLIETVKSSCKKDVVYGQCGDKVEIISVLGHVLLVKDLKGNTFPVQIKKTDYKL
jgi:hypothetical protein